MFVDSILIAIELLLVFAPMLTAWLAIAVMPEPCWLLPTELDWYVYFFALPFIVIVTIIAPAEPPAGFP